MYHHDWVSQTEISRCKLAEPECRHALGDSKHQKTGNCSDLVGIYGSFGLLQRGSQARNLLCKSLPSPQT